MKEKNNKNVKEDNIQIIEEIDKTKEMFLVDLHNTLKQETKDYGITIEEVIEKTEASFIRRIKLYKSLKFIMYVSVALIGIQTFSFGYTTTIGKAISVVALLLDAYTYSYLRNRIKECEARDSILRDLKENLPKIKKMSEQIK